MINEDGNEFESRWVELINTLIGVFYRHPSEQHSNLTDALKDVLKKLRKVKKKIIICGDFNYNVLNYDKDNHYARKQFTALYY